MKLSRCAWPCILVGLLLAGGPLRANNLQLSNVRVLGNDIQTAFIEFDVAWDNSWRWTNINHDAAWVFFNYKADGQNEWSPLSLSQTGLNPDGFHYGSGTSIDMIVPDDGMGLFIRRAGEGSGTLAVTNARVLWNFSQHGLTLDDSVRIQAFGVEMVFVDEGSFSVGSGGTEIGSFTEGSWESGNTYPFDITSEGAIEIGPVAGKLWGTSIAPNSNIGIEGTLPDDYPKGFAAFYCMKHPISQGQYADFLNSLTRDQQVGLFVSTTVSNFMHSGAVQTLPANLNGVRLIDDPGAPYPRIYANDLNTDNPPNSADDGRDLACAWLHRTDGAAFADWARLRPMSELEYEKACRGPLPPEPDEFPWGNTTVAAIGALTGTFGSGEETYSSGNAVYSGSNPGGPVRAGIFATSDSTRAQAGASYWGIMDLGGNTWERVMPIGIAAGRNFKGVHGDGVLTSAGGQTIAASDWPGTIGSRGGSWALVSSEMCVSGRGHASFANAGVRSGHGGWRGVRTAPAGITP